MIQHVEEKQAPQTYYAYCALRILDLSINPTTPNFANFRNIKMSADSILDITYALNLDSSIEKIGLAKTQIGDLGAIYLARFLKNNTNITYVDLRGNQIGLAGAYYMATVVRSNKTIEYLALGHNNIGDKGAIYIAEALKSNTTLTSLHLKNSNISSRGILAINEAIKGNTTLENLVLCGNSIEAVSSGCYCIATSVASHL